MNKKSSHQQPKIPEVKGDCAENLHYGGEQNDIFEVPKTRMYRV